jgi:hypothetical protein
VVCPRKEAAGQVYGVFAGTMGEIELYVAAEDETARGRWWRVPSKIVG